MFKKNMKLVLVVLALIFAMNVLTPLKAEAVGDIGGIITGNLRATRIASGLPETENPADVIALAIKGALGLVAIIFFFMIIIAGFSWMMAGGNEETIGKAKKNIANAIIGLLVIMFAYAITFFVFDIILNQGGA